MAWFLCLDSPHPCSRPAPSESERQCLAYLGFCCIPVSFPEEENKILVLDASVYLQV